MKNILFYTFVLLLFSCADSKKKFLHPDSVSPEIYEVLLENDAVKVIMATFKAGQKDKMHDHYPMTFHVLQGGRAKVILPDGSVNEREIPSGFTGYSAQGQRHQVTNIGEDEVKILLFEEKKSRTKPETAENFLHPESSSPEIYEVLLENAHVKVLMVTFDSGEGDQMHDHNPMTFHVIEGGKAKVTLPDGTVNEREIPSGFTGYNPKGQRHQVTNVGDNQVKILLVEHS